MNKHAPPPRPPQSALPFGEEHQLLRKTAQRFFEQECVPHREDWEKAGMAPDSIWRRAGELGLLCMSIPAEYGGGGGDILHSIVLIEEQARSGCASPMLSLHNDVVAPYLLHYGREDQKHHYLPRMASGELIGAVAMTEPQSGSDLRGIRTTATREGDHWRVSGRKTFISHGCTAGLIVLAAKTRGEGSDERISLFLVETAGLHGFHASQPLHKLGQGAADTAELAFDNVKLPLNALLGESTGAGFQQLTARLVEERLMTGAAAVALMDAAIEATVAYVKERRAFGQRVMDFQNTRFKLAEARTEATVARTFLESCVLQFLNGALSPAEAAMLKYWTTDLQCSIVDACVQLHGGYGYILDYPIARMWCDSRIAKIYGGANEIMKEIIGRSL
ncbi:MAG: acyl-CoA dehydrogenase family protein [Hyphomonadaceae bacterium]|nr:acyl-CoA dehydrogenase family protein [Hyphomonadaceae bacterium]MBX3511612.1 acyl-CoA dehydrogenase family protein [Hyphomonadaceae bacterium]